MEIILIALVLLLFGAKFVREKRNRAYLWIQLLTLAFGVMGMVILNYQLVEIAIHPWVWGWLSVLLVISGISGLLAYFGK